MDLKRLPPSLLVALGLVATGADSAGCTTGACLDVAGPEATTGPCLDVGVPGTSSGSTGPGGETGSTVGPCLDVAPGTTTSQTGPTTGTGSGSSSGSGTDTDTDTDGTGTDTEGETDSGTSTGGAPDGGEAADRGSVLGRLLDADILPPDVAQRLRSKG